MDCPGCGAEVYEVAETTDHYDIKQWGVRKPIRQIERGTLDCPACERIFVTFERDVTPEASA